ncbi:conserved hypothetical protein [Gluconacetobacter diazotrophicus PA1 5]|uniref:Putative membrane protein n=1 Tax=Gluconacetobacter diazotrophicus (strain ATCC 49037 / DSM 5601 / CCUG 37298 / CIP 103539 / LMG 7603 / PAl5) TaxID=272568 RepID=A9HLM8_GLUDA|nr:hypothetical protein [Gluconacetobacter diazotrophicus]ACI50261.1 conserved hypothetical protein [Gluconacetobacter diazotrophicus PA1 5]TWB07984.1 hypothetical protein FBZ86_1082 [Gluconacetobacter diazotrophicus]CAP56189.1 putative membrane protein [Gluconacetobacter diazotrophicus PA1 5]
MSAPLDDDSDDVLDRTTLLFVGLVEALDADRLARQHLAVASAEQAAKQAMVQAEAIKIVRMAGKIARVSEQAMTRRPVLPVLIAGLVGAAMALIAVGGGYGAGRLGM